MTVEAYRDQVKLLLDILPLVMDEEVFALKGGTALNLFEWDLPRLSVDIDLTYIPNHERAESLKAISEALVPWRRRARRCVRSVRLSGWCSLQGLAAAPAPRGPAPDASF